MLCSPINTLLLRPCSTSRGSCRAGWAPCCRIVGPLRSEFAPPFWPLTCTQDASFCWAVSLLQHSPPQFPNFFMCSHFQLSSSPCPPPPLPNIPHFPSLAPSVFFSSRHQVRSSCSQSNPSNSVNLIFWVWSHCSSPLLALYNLPRSHSGLQLKSPTAFTSSLLSLHLEK